MRVRTSEGDLRKNRGRVTNWGTSKACVLVLVAHYLPGYQSGGPVRTIANLVRQLGEEFDFRIVTRDRDAFESEPYLGITLNRWNTVGNAQVHYLSPGALGLWRIVKILRSTPHDVLYLNSFFDPVFTILPLVARRFGLAPRTPAILAPRGEFSGGAFSLKYLRKRLFVIASRIVRLHSDLFWQASSEHEAGDIRGYLKVSDDRIWVARDLPSTVNLGAGRGYRTDNRNDRSGPLKVVFLSRIAAMKNLDFVLRVLAKVSIPIELDVIGPVDDAEYWRRCQKLGARLPANARFRYRGPVPPQQVPAELAAHDLFFLPTRGENYGHAIAEALAVGTPVLIADRTPWRGLGAAGVGWDLPLEEGELPFAECIERVAAMPEAERAVWRNRIRAWAEEQLNDPDAVDANRELFRTVAGSAAR